jgi:hypothetical protein
MQPRVLVPDAELVAEEAGEPAPVELDELVDGAELLLLPHAATTSVADTASAAVAHALSFTLPPLGGRRRAVSLESILGCTAGYARLCRHGRGHARVRPARCRIGTGP